MIVQCAGLRVEYAAGPERLTVLDIPAWSLARGAQAAITGPSGSGKSTLLHVLAGLLVPAEGEVVVDGASLYALGEAARDKFRAERLACVFQTFNLLQGYSALENVMLGAVFGGGDASPGRARDLLARVGLEHRLRHRPARLSVGEQQRVAIARAFAKEPRLLLADEPTGSLDPRNKRVVVELLRGICRERGCALLVVSHEEDVAAAFEVRVDFQMLNRALAAAGAPGARGKEGGA